MMYNLSSPIVQSTKRVGRHAVMGQIMTEVALETVEMGVSAVDSEKGSVAIAWPLLF